MSQNHGWKGRLPKFDAVHIDTPERFVGNMGIYRVSIAMGDMGLWEADVMVGGTYTVDQYLLANNMDQAIAQALNLAGLQTNNKDR